MVDEIVGKSSDIAEQSCRRRRPEFYSKQIVQQRCRVSILRSHLNALRQGVDRTRQLENRIKRSGLDFALPPTRRYTLQALQIARDELHQTCKKHHSVRQAELEAKIDHATQQGNRPRAKVLTAIKKVESNLQAYRTLRAMRRTESLSHSIDWIEIPSNWPSIQEQVESMDQLEDPKTCSNWRLVTDPEEVEYYLMLRNRLHFGQAEGTPFTTAPLAEDIDWEATTTSAESLLQGTYTFESPVPHCKELLQACKRRSALDSIPEELTEEEFKGKIQSWRESTTTSRPSGRHLGKYKALFARGTYPSEENLTSTAGFLEKQDSIIALLLAVINYCIRNAYSLTRWRKVINVMIFKESGNFKIHRLRVIHIYEADFNLLLATKWRQLLRSADEQNLINEGQYGGRPGCEAQSLTLLEELKYDLAYLTRRTLFNFDNDATSCYDRIIVPLASLINRKYGLHRNIVAVHAKTLRDAQFYLKTASGVSDTTYTHCPSFPIHGTGQGSGNSPYIWLFISSTLFDVHSHHAYGASFHSPDGLYSVKFSMVGFVDDSTGTCNDFRPQEESSIQELLTRMEHDAQLWSNLLYCSGGKLELPKCSFYVLKFEFQPNGQPTPSIAKYDNQIHVIDIESATRIPIPSKRAFEPHKTLGHFKSPASRQLTALNAIRQKADRLALLICTSPIDRQGAHMAYHTIFIPSVQYTLPQSFFTRKELKKAQATSLHRIISKCGYNRNTARALMNAPTNFAGGGFLPWYMLQGEGQIKHFLKHWRTDTIVSQTLRVAVSWAQWQSGHDTFILEDTKTPLPYVECRWLLMESPRFSFNYQRQDLHHRPHYNAPRAEE